MNLYQQICNQILLPLSDRLSGLDVYNRLKSIDAFQWKTRKDIEEHQFEFFLNGLDVVIKEVPFYQSYFKKNHLSLGSFTSLDDLNKLPIITKNHLRNHFDKLCRKNFSGKTFEMKSSGSTGEQTTVLIDNVINSDVFSTQLLFWSWGGFYMGAPHLQTGMSLKRGLLKKLKDLVFLCSYTSAFGLTNADLNKIVSQLKGGRTKYLFGYASSVFVIASHAAQKGHRIKLNKIFTWGDCLFPQYRALIEDAFSCKVIDCYGLGEGLQVACQCGQSDCLHIAEHNVHVELVDGEGRNINHPNQIGRVIVTRFEPGPMPLIRYETGDLASFATGSCPCGRKLKLISRIQGRDTDIIRSPEGDRMIVHFFTQIFEMIPEIIQFQVRQNKLEEIDILYVPNDNFHIDVLKRIEQQIHDSCSFKLKINFFEVDNIPLQNSNKRRFVISSLSFA